MRNVTLLRVKGLYHFSWSDEGFSKLLGLPLFLLVTRARLHFVNREQSMAASGLYDGSLFTPAVTVVWWPSSTLQTWPEQHMLIDVTAHVRELFVAKRWQLNVITCRSTQTVNTSCSVYTSAGSQRLTRHMWNDELFCTLCERTTVTNNFWRNTFLYDYTTHICESVGAWPCRRSMWQAVPRQPSDYHRLPPDFCLSARGKWVQRQPPDLLSVVVFRPPSSGFHLASPTSYRTVACYVFVCCCAFMF